MAKSWEKFQLTNIITVDQCSLRLLSWLELDIQVKVSTTWLGHLDSIISVVSLLIWSFLFRKSKRFIPIGKVSQGEFGLLVTLGTFTNQARSFARSNSNLRLIDGEELVSLTLQHYEEFDSRYKILLFLILLR